MVRITISFFISGRITDKFILLKGFCYNLIMRIVDALFLGIVQGIGEFLPISSSAHLRLYSYLTSIEYQGVYFDVMLHLGTTFAVFIYFYKDILAIIKNFIKRDSETVTFVFSIIISTIPAVIAGVFLDELVEGFFREVYVVGMSLLIFSFLIYFIDANYGMRNTKKTLNYKDAFIAGLFQSIAIIPGASRSAMSISGLLLRGYSRADAARISFFMSMPVITGAAIFEIKKAGGVSFDLPLVVGFLSSFISGMISIGFLLSFLKRFSLKLFVFYRIIVALFVLIKWFYER